MLPPNHNQQTPQPLVEPDISPEWRTPSQLTAEYDIPRSTLYAAFLTYKLFPVNFIKIGNRNFYKININEPRFKTWLNFHLIRKPKRKPYQRRDIRPAPGK